MKTQRSNVPVGSSPKQRQCSRREFVQTAARLFAAGAPFFAGCTRKSAVVPPLAAVVRDAKRAQAAKQPFPKVPNAVVWDPTVSTYPIVREVEAFVRERSRVYAMVEKALMLLNRDAPENPLSSVVKHGDTVVIKPNWCSQHKFPLPITHPSVIVPIADYACKAGAKKIRIVEAPMTITRAGKWFWGPLFVNVQALVAMLQRAHPDVEFSFQDGNDDKFTWVDVGKFSELNAYRVEDLDHDGHTGFMHDVFFGVPDSKGYNPKRYRRGLYAIANSFLDGDVFINVPKLKTHSWTGVTVALKNLMGLNLRSTMHFLPEEAQRDLKQLAEGRESPMRDVPHFHRTNKPWAEVPLKKQGIENDILWRSLADLNKIILYADRNGVMQNTPQRRNLVVVDGIIGTDRNGPVSSSVVQSSLIVAGTDPVKVDATCVDCIGWNPEVLNLLTNCSAVADLKIGSMQDRRDACVGWLPKEKKFYVPPAIWSDEVIAPKTVRAT